MYIFNSTAMLRHAWKKKWVCWDGRACMDYAAPVIWCTNKLAGRHLLLQVTLYNATQHEENCKVTSVYEYIYNILCTGPLCVSVVWTEDIISLLLSMSHHMTSRGDGSPVHGATIMSHRWAKLRASAASPAFCTFSCNHLNKPPTREAWTLNILKSIWQRQLFLITIMENGRSIEGWNGRMLIGDWTLSVLWHFLVHGDATFVFSHSIKAATLLPGSHSQTLMPNENKQTLWWFHTDNLIKRRASLLSLMLSDWNQAFKRDTLKDATIKGFISHLI